MPAAPRAWEKITLFAFGVFFFLILLLIAFLDRSPTPTSWYIYCCVLALAAGGIAALLPGTLDLKWHPSLRATGALGVAVLLFYVGKDKITNQLHVHDLKSYLVFQTQDATAPGPATADVYVVINSRVVKCDLVSTSTPQFEVADKAREKDIDIVRGIGGIRVDFDTLRQGDKIFVVLQENGIWWVSSEMTIPEAELQMASTSPRGLINRIHNAQ
jgi:hypothetical protein